MVSGTGSRKRRYANGSVERATKRVKNTTSHLPTCAVPATYEKITSIRSMSTRALTLACTRRAVFNTYELLEHILLHLPIVDILTARSVNRHWDILITTSHKLLQRTFLANQPAKKFWACELATAKITCLPYREHERLELGRSKAHNNFFSAVINDFLFREKKDEEKESLMHRAVYCEAFRFSFQPDFTLLQRPGSEENQILKMRVCQPPTKEVVALFVYGTKPLSRFRKSRRSGMQYDRSKRVEVTNTEGVTYGDILREFLKVAHSDGSVLYGLGASYKVQKARNVVVCLENTQIWIKRMIFPTVDEVRLVDYDGHRPEARDVVELADHVRAAQESGR